MLVSKLFSNAASKPVSKPGSISSSMLLKISSTLAASCLLAAVAVTLGASSAAAASPNKAKHAAVAKHGVYRPRVAAYRDPRFTRGVRAQGEYPYIPRNAIRMPGYIFVPGVGILGESCDLPTSSCSNEYRDIQ
jgi:hypothetical protein